MFCWNKRQKNKQQQQLKKIEKKEAEQQQLPEYKIQKESNNNNYEIKDIILKQNFELLNNSVKNFQCLLDKIDKLHEKIDIIKKQPKEIKPPFNNTNSERLVNNDIPRFNKKKKPSLVVENSFNINERDDTRWSKTNEEHIKDSKERSNFNNFNTANHWDSVFQ